MHSSPTKVLISIAAVAALAVPAGATAKQGADDPPGHVRHGSHAAGQVKHSSTRDDHRGRGRGADDGPNHT
jgi:hypothetical protein